MDKPEMDRQLREQGFCIIPDVLSPEMLARARSALDRGVEQTRASGRSTHIAGLDPNASNIRVNNLPAVDPVFIDLLKSPEALSAVELVLGRHFLISNFTANIALPGSGSMRLHSDQALVVPPPWVHPWAINIVWALDDIHEANGATRYLPGSHRFQTPEDVPADALERTVPFEARAGSLIALEGRLWHTSGKNVMSDGQRRMLFAYYSSDFIRQELNWGFALSRGIQSNMDDQTRRLFGLEAVGNTRIAVEMTTLQRA